MFRNLLTAAVLASVCATASAQVSWNGSPLTIDFTGYTGTGFTPTPAAGQLDSDNWASTGMSDGALAYGGTATTGDYARGSSGGGVTTGGFYAFDVGGGNIAFGVQPTDPDFSPGTVTLRVTNNTGLPLTGFDLNYTVYIRNNEDRSSSFNFEISQDDALYDTVPSLDLTSPAALDANGWVAHPMMASVEVPGAFAVGPGASFYLRWTSNDVGGSGSRDEFALDDITLSLPAATLSLATDDTCLGVGDTLTVELVVSDAEIPIVGAQYYAQYDATRLQFIDAVVGDPPFVLEVYPPQDFGGEIFHAVGIAGGGQGTTASVTMAYITFEVLEEACTTVPLVNFSPGASTYLSGDPDVNVALTLNDLPLIKLDQSGPSISGLSVTGGSTDGSCQATVSFSATVTDACAISTGDVSVAVTVPSVNATLGTVSLNLTQVDPQTVTVSGTAPVSAVQNCPAVIQVSIDATDECGFSASTAVDTAAVTDDTAPSVGTVTVSATPIDGTCQSVVSFSTVVTDACFVDADDVEVIVSLAGGTATLGAPTINKVQTDGQTVTVSGNVTVSNLTSGPVTIQVDVTGDDDCGNSSTTGTGSVNLDSTPTISDQPDTQTVCAGASVTFSVTAAGTPAVGYQWRKGGVPIGGATNSSYTINPVTTGDAGSYDVVVSNPCASTTSTAATLNVNTAPNIITHPSNQFVAPGGTATFTVVAGGTAPLSYQWRKDTVPLLGETNSSLVISPVDFADEGTYDVIVTNLCGSVTSNGATLDAENPTADLELVTDDDCLFSAGGPTELVVRVFMSNTTAPVTGGQFFMQYDNTKLDFLNATPGDDPFTREVFRNVTEATGTITYLVGIENNGTATTADKTMAYLYFAPLQEDCASTSLVWFIPNFPPTRLSGIHDEEVTTTNVGLDLITIDGTNPSINGLVVTGGDVDIGCEATVTFSATVTDNCGITASNVSVAVSLPTGNAAMGTPSVTLTQISPTEVDVVGSVVVSAVEDCPATVLVTVDALDDCNNPATQASDSADVNDVSAPVISGLSLAGGTVDAGCEATLTFGAVVTDNCFLDAADVTVNVSLTTGNALLGTPSITLTQNDDQTVTVAGSFTVSDVEDCPASVLVTIDATDDCLNAATQAADTADVVDTSAPIISGLLVTGGSVDTACTATVSFSALVTDNCFVDSADVSVGVSLLTGNAVLGIPTINRIQTDGQTVTVSGTVEVSDVEDCPATVLVTIDALDDCGNPATTSSDTADVTDDTAPVFTSFVVNGASASGSCETTVTFSAVVEDNCFVDSADVAIQVNLLTANATLGTPNIVLVQTDEQTVTVTGDVTVSAIQSCPVVIEVVMDASDDCANAATTASDTAAVNEITPPNISGLIANGASVDANCEATVTFSATVTDNCAVAAADVDVGVSLLTGNASLGTPAINRVQIDPQTVAVSGTVAVSNLENCPATVQVTVDAVDGLCGNVATQALVTADVIDDTAPVVSGLSVVGGSMDAACEFTVSYTATVTDNCFVDAADVTVNVSLTTGNATISPASTNIVQSDPSTVTISGTVEVSDLTSCPATVLVTVDAGDDCLNAATQASQTADVIDATTPVVTAPPDISVHSDAGGCSATFSTLALATVSDNCVPGLTPTFVRSDGKPNLLDPYDNIDSPISIVWSAADPCGNSSSATQVIVVSDKNEMITDIELSPNLDDQSPFAGDLLNRCIRFEFWGCPGTTPMATVNQVIAFPVDVFQPHRAVGVSVLAPCDAYTCVTARDRLHTLRSTAPDFSDDGVTYSASFIGNRQTGGHWLLGGNLNDDSFIDILDFGSFVVRFQTNYSFPAGHTNCSTPPFHADISGDGRVFTEDFTFIQINILKFSEPNCCGQPMADLAPVTSISVADLWRSGRGELAAADLNQDGVLDMEDMAEFSRGIQAEPDPEVGSPIQPSDQRRVPSGREFERKGLSSGVRQ